MRQGVISQRTAWIHEQAKFISMLAFPLKLKWSGITVLSSHHSGSDQRRARFGAKNGAPHDRLEAVIFTPTDWHLLRKSQARCGW